MATAYKDAGVDIHAGYEVVSRIKKHVKKTVRPGVMGSIGAFGGLFSLNEMGMGNLKEPVLVSGTDSVGSKVKLAVELDRHDTIGIDVVAMCVNDIVTAGAEPLFFLDYIGCGSVDPAQIEDIVKGVSEGCVQAGCALVGGETAEIAGLYAKEDYDLAGFAVGIVEKKDIIDGTNIVDEDLLVGLPSSGLHSNGFSLVRKIISDAGLNVHELKDILLEPTKIYVKTILTLLKEVEIKGIAHITGGGLIENIPRIMPVGLGAEITKNSWEIPEIFNILKTHGNIAEEEMYNIFNMGVGMVLVVSPQDAKKIDAPVIGKVIKGEGLTFG